MFKRKVNITQIKKNELIEMQDEVLIESPIDMYINSKSLVNIICLPKDLKDLAIGFLHSIGLIDIIDDISEIKIDEEEQRIDIELRNSIQLDFEDIEFYRTCRVIDTSCGIASPWRKIMIDSLDRAGKSIKKNVDLRISSDIIHNCMIKMQKETVLFRETGGCHGAALFDFSGNLLSVKEDIGRHNAIDKVIGEILQRKKFFSQLLLTSTGRLTGDSVLKAVRAGIPIVASLSTAIDSGIRLAQAYGISLLGFVRGARMNVYTYPNRIKV